MTVASIILYLIFLLAFIAIEKARHKNWSEIVFLKSRWHPSAILSMYVISFVFMLFFTVISVTLLEDDKSFAFFVTATSVLIESLACLCSRISIVITDKEVIKRHIFGKTVIPFKDIDAINIGHYIRIKSKNKAIIIERRAYDKEMKLVKRKLFEMSLAHR